MSRQPLLHMLARYREAFPAEAAMVDRICRLVESHANCFDRTCRPGHITGAAWILSTDRRRCASHASPQARPLAPTRRPRRRPVAVEEVALREAREESGLTRFDIVPINGVVMPFDIDVHDIPARYDAARPTDRRRPRTPRHPLPDDRPLRRHHRSAKNRTSSPGSRPTKCSSAPTKRASCECSTKRSNYLG